jgi:hypothetical protein
LISFCNLHACFQSAYCVRGHSVTWQFLSLIQTQPNLVRIHC